MAAEMGIVKTLIGTATATSPDGSKRNLLLGDRVYADEIITTDSTSDIEIEFSEGDVLDLGKNSQTTLTNGLPSPAEMTSLIVDDDVNAIQQALLQGADPTKIAPATAAGTGAGTGAKSGNEGVTIVNTDYLAPEAVVTSGFETTGPARLINDFEDFDLFEDVVTLTQSAATALPIDLILSVDEDNTLTSTVLENPVDINGLPLTVTDFTVNGITQAAGTPATIDNVGTLTIDPNGDLTFTPVANYNGTVPTVTHNISNGTTTDDSTLQIIVNSVDDIFTDANESDSMDEDTIKTGSVLADPIDDNGLPLSVTAFTVNGITATAGNPVNIPNVGSLTIDPNGDYTFTPVANYNGDVPTATYTVTNGDTSVQSNLDITVNAVQDTFTDENETVIGDGNTTLTGSVLESSTDNNNLPLTVTSFTVNGTTATAGSPVDIPDVGLLTIDSNGAYTFEPVTDFNGPVPTADYTVSNGETTDDSTLDITINPATSSFTDDNETVSGDEDTEQTGTVLEKTVDDNGAALTVTTFTVEGTTVTAGTPVAIPNIGSLTIDSDGTYTFTPVANFNGDVPTATYTVTNGSEFDQSTLDITVNPATDTFTDDDETGSGLEDTPQSGTVLADPTSTSVTSFTVAGTTVDIPDGGSNSVNIDNIGAITIQSNGEYLFTPVEHYSGAVPPIAYTVTDGTATDTSELTIEVTPVADAPNLSIIVDNDPSLILPPTSGLTKTVFAATGQNRTLLDSDLLEELTDNLSATGENSNQPYPTGGKTPSTNIAADSIEATTGLIYLEAGSTISFSGFADDSLLIELGGKTLVSTTGDMWGEYDSAETGTSSGVQNLGEVTTTGPFIADKSGYYTLEMYVYNHGGPGRLSVNVSIDGTPPIALSSDELPLYTNNSSVNVPDNLFEDLDFDTDTDGGFYQADPDGYGYAIKLDASLIDTDGSETLSGISLTDLPAGVTLSSTGNPDGTYNPGTYNLISDHILTEAEINAIKGSVTSEELATNATPKTATTVELAEIGSIDTTSLDSSAGDGTALNPADLLSDDSDSIAGLAADHTGGTHLAASTGTADLASLAITNPVATLPELLATDSINQG